MIWIWGTTIYIYTYIYNIQYIYTIVYIHITYVQYFDIIFAYIEDLLKKHIYYSARI